MKAVHYSEIAGEVKDAPPTLGGVTGRVLIGGADGAENFCMRLFVLDPGGYTPRHEHAWEHEIFVHQGQGEILMGETWNPVKAGCAAFIPGDLPHQIKNTGTEPFAFVCLIPSGPPELF